MTNTIPSNLYNAIQEYWNGQESFSEKIDSKNPISEDYTTLDGLMGQVNSLPSEYSAGSIFMWVKKWDKNDQSELQQFIVVAVENPNYVHNPYNHKIEENQWADITYDSNGSPIVTIRNIDT